MNQQVVSLEAESAGAEESHRQYVVFSLKDENYGIEISSVKEIVKWTTITKLPDMAPEMAGMIKLREEVIPVISLHRRFGLAEPENKESTKIVILETGGKTIGINVDDVEEVVNVTKTHRRPGEFTDGSNWVEGIAKLEDYLLILLDVDNLFSNSIDV